MVGRIASLALFSLVLFPLLLGDTPADAKHKHKHHAKGKTVTRTFSNTSDIDIDSFLTRSSQITVGGFKKGKITDVDVVIHGFNHTLPDDVDIMIVAPDARNAIVMSDAGGAEDASSLTLALDDDAREALPNSDPLLSGAFKPANFDANSDLFLDSAAPAPSGDVALATFDNADPNGVWTLYVYDDDTGGIGSLVGGWSLQISAKSKTTK